jgi:hypothetical protein
MTKEELRSWLTSKGWVEKEADLFYKDKRRFRLNPLEARFQKWSAVNGWRTIYFQNYNALSVTEENKLHGLNVMIRNKEVGNDSV